MGFQISWKYYTQKIVSNIYVHYFVCSSQHRSDLNHTHPQKDITILIIIYIQFFIIYDKNGVDNPNGRQFENHFILISKHNVQSMHIFDVAGLNSTECELLELTRDQIGKEKKRGSLFWYLWNSIMHLCNYFFFLQTFSYQLLHSSFQETTHNYHSYCINCSASRAASTIQFSYMASKTLFLH